MAWPHVSTDATIAPRASNLRPDFGEIRTPLIPTPLAAIAAF